MYEYEVGGKLVSENGLIITVCAIVRKLSDGTYQYELNLLTNESLSVYSKENLVADLSFLKKIRPLCRNKKYISSASLLEDINNLRKSGYRMKRNNIRKMKEMLVADKV